MGIRIEREQLLKYISIYESLKIKSSSTSFIISGKIDSWDKIEVICRIFYKQLEELFYSKELKNKIYENTIKRKLKKTKMIDKSFFDVLKENNFSIDKMKVLLIKLDDEVYYNVRKKLPYIQDLSLISNAVNELLENTKKYTSGEFVLSAILKEGEYPLSVIIENKYDSMDASTKKNIENLGEDINTINNFKDPSKMILKMLRDRAQLKYDPEERRSSRFGFSKIHLETGSKFEFSQISEKFGENGITITLKIPLKIVEKEKLQKEINEILKSFK